MDKPPFYMIVYKTRVLWGSETMLEKYPQYPREEDQCNTRRMAKKVPIFQCRPEVNCMLSVDLMHLDICWGSNKDRTSTLFEAHT